MRIPDKDKLPVDEETQGYLLYILQSADYKLVTNLLIGTVGVTR